MYNEYYLLIGTWIKDCLIAVHERICSADAVLRGFFVVKNFGVRQTKRNFKVIPVMTTAGGEQVLHSHVQ